MRTTVDRSSLRVHGRIPSARGWCAVAAIVVFAAAGCTGASGEAVDRTSTSTAASSDTASQDPANSENESPQELLAQALSAAYLEGSVHVVSTTIHGRHRSVFDDYASALDGTQDITIDKMHAAVRVTPEASYARGNAAARTRFFGFPPSVAKALGDRWFEVRPGDHLYEETTEDVLLHEVLADFPLVESSESLVERVIDGTSLVGVRGTPAGADPATPAVATWWLEADAPHLPVRLVATAGKDRYVRAFSDWRETRTVVAPADSVRLSRLWTSGGAEPTAQ
jgi:hypothetical protein